MIMLKIFVSLLLQITVVELVETTVYLFDVVVSTSSTTTSIKTNARSSL